MKRSIKYCYVVIIAVMATFLAGACATTDDLDPDNDGGGQVIRSTPPPVAAPALGTRNNPYPAGENFQTDNWDIIVGASELDVLEDILDENMFNDPPAEGNIFVLAPVAVEYIGDESGVPWIDLTFRFYGSSGNTYDAECGVVPDDIIDIGEMFPGASATGNICAEVPEDQVVGGAWIVEDTFSFIDDTRVFVAVSK